MLILKSRLFQLLVGPPLPGVSHNREEQGFPRRLETYAFCTCVKESQPSMYDLDTLCSLKVWQSTDVASRSQRPGQLRPSWSPPRSREHTAWGATPGACNQMGLNQGDQEPEYVAIEELK